MVRAGRPGSVRPRPDLSAHRGANPPCGDHLMGQEKRQWDLTVEGEQNQRDIKRIRENERLGEERIDESCLGASLLS